MQEAHQDFRAGYRSVLADLAEETEDFASFKALAEDFLHTVNRPNETQWEEAVQLVRKGELSLDWLPQRSADLARRIEVVELQDPRSKINDPDTQSPFQSLAA